MRTCGQSTYFIRMEYWGIAAALQAFTLPGDRVLCSGPVYSGFIRTVGDLGRVLCPSMLKPDREGIMRLDLEDMERKILDNKVKAFIFCSPIILRAGSGMRMR